METLFDLPAPTPPADTRPHQLKAMHDRHGVAEQGRKCGGCVHLAQRGGTAGTYFKCLKYGKLTHGPGTDWRLKWQGCGLWEGEKGDA